MKIDSIIIDTSNTKSILCEMGGLHNTDKSPYNTNPSLHKHPYTGIYNMLFAPYRNRDFVFVEIGIEHNASMRMWNAYYNKANIWGFEYYQKKIDTALLDKLDKVTYCHMDVTSSDSIKDGFEKLPQKPFIVIDDSTHQFQDQIRIIENTLPYIQPGGILIIEDIFRNADENKYAEAIKYFNINYALFITVNHALEHTPDWNNSKLLLIYK
jgi:hypothetical protein